MADPFDEVDRAFGVLPTKTPATIPPASQADPFDAVDAEFSPTSPGVGPSDGEDDPFDLVDIEVEADPERLRKIQREKPWVPLTDDQHRQVWEAQRRKGFGAATGELVGGLVEGAKETGAGLARGVSKFLREGSVAGPVVDVATGRKTAGEAAGDFSDAWRSFGSGAAQGVEDLANMGVNAWNNGSAVGDAYAELTGINDEDKTFESYLSRARFRETTARDRKNTPDAGARLSAALAEMSTGDAELAQGIRDAGIIPDPDIALVGEIISPVAPDGAALLGAAKLARATGLSDLAVDATEAATRGVARGVERVAGAAASTAEAADSLIKRGTQLAKDNPLAAGAAGTLGAVNLNPVTAVQAAATVGGIKAAGPVARVLEDVARSASQKRGRVGVFEAASLDPKARKATKKIFSGLRGRALDRAAREGSILFGRGAQGAVVAPLLGFGDIEDSRQLGEAMGTGFSAGAFDSGIDRGEETAMHNRRAEDIDIEDAFSRLDEPSAQTIRGLASFDTVLRSHQDAQRYATAAYGEAQERATRGDADRAELDARRTALERANEELQNAQSLDPDQRVEYERQATLAVADVISLADGLVGDGGRMNIGLQVLPEAEIVNLVKSRNPGMSDADAQIIARNVGFATDPTTGGFAIDPDRPTVVINADRVAQRLSRGEKLPRVIMHEAFHAMDQFPAVQEALGDLDRRLFGVSVPDVTTGQTQQIIPGLYTQDDLVAQFRDSYTRGYTEAERMQQFSDLYPNGRLDPSRVADYMKREVRAEYAAGLSGNLDGSLVSSLRNPLQAARDWVSLAQSNTMLGRARDALKRLGVDIDTDPQTGQSKLLGVDLDPQMLVAVRNALRQVERLNGDLGVASGYSKDPAPVTVQDILKDPRLQDRYGDQVFDTEMVVIVTAPDGSVREQRVSGDNALKINEGAWVVRGGALNQMEGAGNAPTGVTAPEGSTVTVSRDFARNPDGTPKVLTTRELERRATRRDNLIRQAIDAAPDTGAPNRLRDTGNGVYRGVLTPTQLDALEALPDSIVAPSLKQKIRDLNEILQRGDGTRVMMEYQAALKGGKYRSLSPKFRDEVPIGFHFSKAGNFLVTTMSVSRVFDKLNAWRARMPKRLEPWGGDVDRVWADMRTYLANHAAGRPGEVRLDPDPAIALRKKNILNDLLGVYTKETEGLNPDRTKVGTGKTKRRGDDDVNRIITSRRIDRITDMTESNAEKLPIDYGKVSANFMPDQESLDVRRAELPPYESSMSGGRDGYPVHIELIDPETKQRIGEAQFTLAGFVEHTGVEPEYLGKGYGEALYREIAKAAQKLGIKGLYSDWATDEAIRVRKKLFDTEPLGLYPDGGWRGAISAVPSNIQFMPAEPGFYSQLEKVIEEKMPTRASAQQIRGIIDPAKGSGVKAEEIKWSGINEWLDENPTATKEELLQHLRDEGRTEFVENRMQGPYQQTQAYLDLRDSLTRANQESETAAEEMKKAVKAILVEKGHAEDISEAVSQNTPNTFLDQLKAEVPEVQAYLDSRRRAEQIHKDLIDAEESGRLAQGTKFSQYVLPGGKNYREVVLAIPKSQSLSKSEVRITLTFPDGKKLGPVNTTPENAEQIRQEYSAPKPGDVPTPRQKLIADVSIEPILIDDPSYESSHFPNVPNYVAHMRLNDRTDAEGRPGLFIEEIQSDRHQAGREKGYASDIKALDAELSELLLNIPEEPAAKEEARLRVNEIRQQLREKGSGIPDAPFRKDWPLQLFKRALREAVETGKDWIGWTTGDTQAERYDLSKQVDAIKLSRARTTPGSESYIVYAKEKGRSEFREIASAVSRDKLPEYIGKELTQKADLDNFNPGETLVLEGADLKIGGEGMKGFYDRILPSEVGKYVKKWGAKVEEGAINDKAPEELVSPFKVELDSKGTWNVRGPSGDWISYEGMGEASKEAAQEAADNYFEGFRKSYKMSHPEIPPSRIHRVNVTPAMRESVKKGQPQFMPDDRYVRHEKKVAKKYGVTFGDMERAVKNIMRNPQRDPMLYKAASELLSGNEDFSYRNIGSAVPHGGGNMGEAYPEGETSINKAQWDSRAAGLNEQTKTYENTVRALYEVTQDGLEYAWGDKPLTLYRGLDPDQEVESGKMAFFTSSKEMARGFAGKDGKVVKYRVPVKNVFFSTLVPGLGRKVTENLYAGSELPEDADEFIVHINDSAIQVGKPMKGREVEWIDHESGVHRGNSVDRPHFMPDDSQANDQFSTDAQDAIFNQDESQNPPQTPRPQLADLLAAARSANPAGGATGQEARNSLARAQHEAVQAALKSQPAIDVESLGPESDARGGEHDVYFEHPDGRVRKIVRNSNVADYGYNPEGESTAYAYLNRIRLMNEHLGDDQRVEGMTPDGRLIISQPFVESAVDETGSPIEPTEDEIEETMANLGFELMPADRAFEPDFYQKDIGDGKTITARDGHEGNFIKTPEGDIKPIDLIMGERDDRGRPQFMPTQDALDSLKSRLPKYSVSTKEEAPKSEGGGWVITLKNDKGTPVGIAKVYGSDQDLKTLDVGWTEVKKKFRGQGYGEALYREIAKLAQKQKYSRLRGFEVTEDANKVRSKLFNEIDGNWGKGSRWQEHHDERADRIPRNMQFSPTAQLDLPLKAPDSLDLPVDDFPAAEVEARLSNLLAYSDDPNTPGDYEITLRSTPPGQGSGAEDGQRITLTVKGAASLEDAKKRAQRSSEYRRLQMRDKRNPEVEGARLLTPADTE